jgi:hypothetical protein
VKVLVIDPIRYCVSGVVSEPECLLPEDLVPSEDGRADRRHPLLCLSGCELPLEILAERIRR